MRPFALALALVVALPALAVAQPVSQWQGPNLLLTAKRLQDVKDAVGRGDPLMTQAVKDVIREADAALGQTPNPIKGVLKVPGFYTKQKAVQQQISAQIRTDGYAANALAMGFAFTGNVAYADKAKEFIAAWVGSLTKPKDGGSFLDYFILEHGGDTALVMSYSFPEFLYAYDVLRGLGKIDSFEHAQFKTWLRPFIAYHTDEEIIKNNHHNWQTLFLAVCAHVTEDRPLFDRAVKFYRNGMANHQIARDGAMWRELLRSEKAATYTLMAAEAMVQFIPIAENHGYTGLRDLVAGKRTAIEWTILNARTFFKSTGIPADGGKVITALESLRDFINNPGSWNARYGRVIKSNVINAPADRADWGWLFEVAYAWTGDASYRPLMTKAPYGLRAERVYTLSYATLLYRPL